MDIMKCFDMSLPYIPPPQRTYNGKTHSKPDDGRNLKKLTTRRLKIGVKFGKDFDGGIEAGLGCGYEKRIDSL